MTGGGRELTRPVEAGRRWREAPAAGVLCCCTACAAHSCCGGAGLSSEPAALLPVLPERPCALYRQMLCHLLPLLKVLARQRLVYTVDAGGIGQTIKLGSMEAWRPPHAHQRISSSVLPSSSPNPQVLGQPGQRCWEAPRSSEPPWQQIEASATTVGQQRCFASSRAALGARPSRNSAWTLQWWGWRGCPRGWTAAGWCSAGRPRSL